MILDESRGPDLYADQGRWSSDGVCFRWADNNSGGDDYHYCQNPTMVGFWLVGIRWGTMTDDDDDRWWWWRWWWLQIWWCVFPFADNGGTTLRPHDTACGGTQCGAVVATFLSNWRALRYFWATPTYQYQCQFGQFYWYRIMTNQVLSQFLDNKRRGTRTLFYI